MVVLPLLPLYAPSNVDRYRRRGDESERARNLGEVEGGDVEDGLERVRGVGLDVGAETIAGGLVEVVVFGDQLLELFEEVIQSVQS